MCCNLFECSDVQISTLQSHNNEFKMEFIKSSATSS